MAELPELGTLGPKHICALMRVAPLNGDSGQSRGKCEVRGGKAPTRASLYMGTLVGTHYNSVLKGFYGRLQAASQLKQVALMTCMSQLLTVLNAMLRDCTP